MGLETWTKENADILTCLLKLPPDMLSKCQQYGINESVNMENYYPTISTDPSAYSLDPSYYSKNLTPAAFFIDTDQYTGATPTTSLSQGLAEYTNSNFVSDDTIFTEALPTDDRHYFPYPRKTSTNIQELQTQTLLPITIISQDGVEEKSFYIKKNIDGEMIEHFVKPKYFTNNVYSVAGGGGYIYDRTFYRDEKCHKDYAKKLLPRAVGYSAGLLNYFFRGNIEITPSSNGVYALAEPTSGGFTTIKLRAQNTTENEEEMPAGTVQLVVKYQPAQDTPFIYQVVSDSTGTRPIPRDAPVELTFNLSTAIPFTATDVYLQLVYHGRLGNEDGAVAVGFNDISEPTPIDIYNNMDKICIGGSWYDLSSEATITAAKNAADSIGNHNGIADETDIYPHNLKTVYVKISPSGNPQPASDTDYDFLVSNITPSTLSRPAYILAEVEPEGVSDFYYSLYDIPEKINSVDTWGHIGMLYQFPGTAVQNQVEYVEDPAQCDGAPSCDIRQTSIYYTFRGQQLWWGGGLIYLNIPYPTDSQCSIGAL